MSRVNVTLRTIGARLLWDGRTEKGRAFIPGIGHYQAGVQVLDAAARAGDAAAERSLSELEGALSGAEAAVRRWHYGVEHYIDESLGGRLPPERAWLQEERSVRVWLPEVERLAHVIASYDDACALTSLATAGARARNIFNPHHESIRGRAGTIRHVVDLGYSGRLYGRRLSMEGSG